MYGEKPKKQFAQKSFHPQSDDHEPTIYELVQEIEFLISDLSQKFEKSCAAHSLSPEDVPGASADLQYLSLLLQKLDASDELQHKKKIQEAIFPVQESIIHVRKHLDEPELSCEKMRGFVLILIKNMKSLSATLPLAETPAPIRILSTPEIEEALSFVPIQFHEKDLPTEVIHKISELILEIWNDARVSLVPDQKTEHVFAHTLVFLDESQQKQLKAISKYTGKYLLELSEILKNFDPDLIGESMELITLGIERLEKSDYVPVGGIPEFCLGEKFEEYRDLLSRISERLQNINGEFLTDLFSNIVGQLRCQN